MGLTIRDLVRHVLPALAMAIVMGVIVFGVGLQLTRLPPLALLATQVGGGALVYFGLVRSARLQALDDVMGMLRSRTEATVGGEGA